MRAILVSLALSATAFSPAKGQPFETQAPIAYLIDMSSNRVLLDRDSRKQIPTASMAKMMTAYVAFEAMRDGRLTPDTRFAVKAATWQTWNNQGSTMFLRANERVRVDDLLHGILTLSGNDASIVLAEGMRGSEADFVERMNAYAVGLNMRDSHFETANGWPDQGKTYSTARDLSTLARQIIVRHPKLFKEYFSQRSLRWNGVEQANRNPLLGAVPGADGMKTGHSDEAGYCLTGTAERGGRRLIMVVAGLPTMQARIDEARALMQWGFDNWRETPLFRPSQIVTMVPLQLGDRQTVGAATSQRVAMLNPIAEKAVPDLRVRYSGPIKAPVRKGQKIAELFVRYPDDETQVFPLYATNNVDAAGFWRRASNGLQSLWGRWQ